MTPNDPESGRFIVPNAPRTLSEKPANLIDALNQGGSGTFRVTRAGFPIEPLPEGTMGSETRVIDKINEIIGHLNAAWSDV